ncbi:MAG: right-handed parallel beta-helix repeat-containing protein [Candidatus Bipolaricaulota bacterium]|nr:right-handed parallel beta-helix repeat-containing protein [Candidatus Bipolaricaulota bacterium]MDW8141767.1 right-handed parallel beta-helix repeat-containing protein [Candidatus Bipolaricaulota bacterium]
MRWLFVALGLSLTVALAPAEIVVHCERESLQSAIDRAPPKAVITLSEGVCQENLVITKELTLRGQSAERSLVKGSKPGFPVIFIHSDQPIVVTIESLTLAEALKASNDPRHGRECAVFYPELLCPSGVQVRGGAQLRLREARILRHPWVGVYVLDTAHATVQATEIAENGWGIYVSPEATVRLEQSRVIRQRENGLEIWGRAEVRESTISESGRAGIEIFGEAKLSENAISANREAGVLLSGNAHAELMRNTLTVNSWGIAARLRRCGYLSDDFRGTAQLEGNRFANNRLGSICLP